MWLGTMKHSNSNILEFKSTKNPIKVLGTFLSYNQNKNIEENFLSRIRKMKTKLHLWLSRDLTLYERSLLAKTLGVSQLVYAASMLTVPSLVIKSVQTELFSFLWKNKKDKIKRTVMYQPFAEGGLNFVNFFAVVKSLRLAWISRLLSSTTDSWKTIPNYYLNTYGGLKFLLKCNYNPSSVNNSLLTFYRELLEYFQEFKEKTNIFSYGKFLLWNNEAITIDKNTLFWKSWFKKNILSVQAILNADGNFLTFQEFQDKFNIKTDYLHYFQLIAAIPSDLKKKARECEAPSHELLNTTTVSLFPGSPIDLADMRCKHYYNILNKNPTVEPTGIKAWKVNYADTYTEWNNNFSFIYHSTRDNKLRQFSFRLLHRIIVTKKELLKFRLTDNATCIFCPNLDSIEHTFLHCSEIKSFYSEALVWFNRVNDTEINLSNEQITFMKYPTLINYPKTHDADCTYLLFF